MDCLSAANSSFALDLFKTLNENDNKCNLFFSPLSISSALAMVYLGAKGNTAAQMSKVLQLAKAKDVHTGFQSLICEINKPGTDYLLRIANRLYGEKSFAFIDEFLGSTQKHYHADLQPVDFCGKANESRKQINNWVAQKTEGFWELWFRSSKMSAADTAHVHPTVSPNSGLQTSSQQSIFLHRRQGMGTLLHKYIQVVLEKELTYEKFLQWTNPEMMDQTQMHLSVPKFKLEDDYDLKSVLINMGMSDAFDIGRSDFSGMSGNNDLVLSKVVHKSFVEVNEEGTEAAGATGVVMMLRCARIVPTFTCDHPFLFFIMHKQSRSILFCGRFSSP
ncbi:hypothetical protein FKM82_006485 [Ascaphus truei]